MKKIVCLIFLVTILSYGCFKKEIAKEITKDDILQSEAIKIELNILQKIDDANNTNISKDDLKKLLIESGSEFIGIKKYFDEIKSDNKDILEIKESQIKMANVYINIKDKLENNGDVAIIMLKLLDAEVYYNKFIDVMKRSNE